MRMMTRTLDERRELLELIASGRILLYRNPDPSYPEQLWYVSIGSVDEERIATDHREPHRRWNLEMVVVDRPVGKLVAAVDATRDYGTFRDKEPDGIQPITPATYGSPNLDGAYSDYTDYVHVLLGGAAAGVRARGGPGAPKNMAYGNSTYPTIQAASTSWSLA